MSISSKSVSQSQTTEIRKERKVQVHREYHMSSNSQQSIDMSSGSSFPSIGGSSFPAIDMGLDMDDVLQSALSRTSDLQSMLSDQMNSALNQSSVLNKSLNQRTTSSTQSNSVRSTSGSSIASNQNEKFSEVIALGGEIGPDDLSVTLKDNVMTIEAKVQKEKSSQDGNSSSSSKMYQEFKKMFTIPSNVDVNQMRTVLTRDGNLKIEAPYQQKALPAP